VLGERVALRPPLEELRLEGGLERGDAARHGGVVGAQAAGGDGQAACAGDCEKEPQIVPIET
jgi:hypothetical protein